MSYLLAGREWFNTARELEKKDKVFRILAKELKRRCDEMFNPDRPRFFDPDDLDSFWWRTRVGTKQLVVATMDLAMAGVYFGEEKYSGLAARMLVNLAENNMAEKARGTCYSYRFENWMQQPLDTGHASEALGISFDLLRTFLTREQSRKIGDYLKKFIAAEEKFISEEGGAKQVVLGNIPMIGRLGGGVLAMSLEKEGLLDAKKFIDLSLFAAMEYLERGGHEEGILPEGPMYGFACLKHIAVLGTVLARRGEDSIWKSSAWDTIVKAYASQTIPSEGTPNPWNDCYPVRITSWLLAVAHYRRNRLARWLWESMVQPEGGRRWDAPVPVHDVRAPWWNALLPHAMVCYDPSVRPSSPEESSVPMKRHFVNRGIYDDRSGWDKNDWYLTATCLGDGRWRNRRGYLHGQADRGHFGLHALGEQFAIDSGYGTEILSGTTEVIRLGYTGEAHNVPEIGGEMQQRPVTITEGFREILTSGWVRVARMEFAGCYENCVRASRTIMIVTGENNLPIYTAIHDCVIPRRAISTFGLLLHTHEKNRVSLIDRETADMKGGNTGNRCRVFVTAMRPGCLALDKFLGHPRLRYRSQGEDLHAVTILAPYPGEEPAPVIERSSYHADDAGSGFTVRLRMNGAEDILMLCREGGLAAFDCETDADFTIVRKADKPKICVVDGTRLIINDKPVFSAEQRKTLVEE